LDNNNNKILVVDDDMMNLDVLWEILSDDYDVKLADSGIKALDILSNFKPDLILLDIMMPIMDGYETAQKIKADSTLSNIPIIFVTALNDMENKIKGFKVGISDYITKPFEYDEIIARVETHIRLKKAIEMINKYNTELEIMLETRTRELINTEKKAAFSLVIAGIIHNLKGPLSGILGGADLLSLNFKKLKIDENEMIRLESFLEIIKTGVTKLDTMINSMMIKAKTDETSTLEIKDLNLLIKRELSFLEANLEFKNKINKDINLNEATPIYIEIIPSEIVQVFQNILNNAIDAMWKQKEKNIKITTGITENNMAFFSIKDNGTGIPKENLNKIFDPFFTTKRKDGIGVKNSDTYIDEFEEPIGTGLGLFSTYQIINKNHGKIDIKTNEYGTEFIISLPLYK
jgi:signal transduction histidine kinase